MLRLATAGLLVFALTGCATPTRFEWGNYENALYAYYKRPETRENYRVTLETAIARGEKTDRLAPGLYAELGYLHLDENKPADAIAAFEKEMAAFPESRHFLTGVVTRLRTGGSLVEASAAPASSPEPTPSPAAAVEPAS